MNEYVVLKNYIPGFGEARKVYSIEGLIIHCDQKIWIKGEDSLSDSDIRYYCCNVCSTRLGFFKAREVPITMHQAIYGLL